MIKVNLNMKAVRFREVSSRSKHMTGANVSFWDDPSLPQLTDSSYRRVLPLSLLELGMFCLALQQVRDSPMYLNKDWPGCFHALTHGSKSYKYSKDFFSFIHQVMLSHMDLTTPQAAAVNIGILRFQEGSPTQIRGFTPLRLWAGLLSSHLPPHMECSSIASWHYKHFM